MPQLKPSDIPDLSNKELEKFLNTTIVELVPEDPRIQNQLYNRGVCIISDLLKTDQEQLQYVSISSLKTIGDNMQEIIHTILDND